MDTATFKPCYGAIPLRALVDQDLHGVPLALLGLIAAHDRFGRNGAGCYASQKRLGELLGVRRETVNRALDLLVAKGIVKEEIAEDDRRRRVYRVVYSERDWAAFRPRSGRRPPPAKPRAEMCDPERTDRAEASAPELAVTGEMCAPSRTDPPPRDAAKPLTPQPKTSVARRRNIFCEAGIDRGEAGLPEGSVGQRLNGTTGSGASGSRDGASQWPPTHRPRPGLAPLSEPLVRALERLEAQLGPPIDGNARWASLQGIRGVQRDAVRPRAGQADQEGRDRAASRISGHRACARRAAGRMERLASETPERAIGVTDRALLERGWGGWDSLLREVR